MISCRCGKEAQEGYDECFRCRVSSVGFSFRGGGGFQRKQFHDRTNAEWMREHLGTTDEKELGKRGIERVKS